MLCIQSWYANYFVIRSAMGGQKDLIASSPFSADFNAAARAWRE